MLRFDKRYDIKNHGNFSISQSVWEECINLKAWLVLEEQIQYFISASNEFKVIRGIEVESLRFYELSHWFRVYEHQEMDYGQKDRGVTLESLLYVDLMATFIAHCLEFAFYFVKVSLER
jgi:hypothetical protein